MRQLDNEAAACCDDACCVLSPALEHGVGADYVPRVLGVWGAHRRRQGPVDRSSKGVRRDSTPVAEAKVVPEDERVGSAVAGDLRVARRDLRHQPQALRSLTVRVGHEPRTRRVEQERSFDGVRERGVDVVEPRESDPQCAALACQRAAFSGKRSRRDQAGSCKEHDQRERDPHARHRAFVPLIALELNHASQVHSACDGAGSPC